MKSSGQIGRPRRGTLERAGWLLVVSGSLALGCWTTRTTTRSGAEGRAAEDDLGESPTPAPTVDDATGRGHVATLRGGAPSDAASPASTGSPALRPVEALSNAPTPGGPAALDEADQAIPPDKAQVGALLEALLGSLEPSRRIQLLLVDDDDCFGPLVRDGGASKALPADVHVEAGAEDSVTSADPSEAGFARLRAALAGHRLPSGRKLIHTRLYGEHTQIGWIALCAVEQPLLDENALLRQNDATSLTFGLTAAAEQRVRDHEPTTARLAFTVDGKVVLALAPLDSLRRQQEPVFTLFQK